MERFKNIVSHEITRNINKAGVKYHLYLSLPILTLLLLRSNPMASGLVWHSAIHTAAREGVNKDHMVREWTIDI